MSSGTIFKTLGAQFTLISSHSIAQPIQFVPQVAEFTQCLHHRTRSWQNYQVLCAKLTHHFRFLIDEQHSLRYQVSFSTLSLEGFYSYLYSMDFKTILLIWAEHFQCSKLNSMNSYSFNAWKIVWHIISFNKFDCYYQPPNCFQFCCLFDIFINYCVSTGQEYSNHYTKPYLNCSHFYYWKKYTNFFEGCRSEIFSPFIDLYYFSLIQIQSIKILIQTNFILFFNFYKKLFSYIFHLFLLQQYSVINKYFMNLLKSLGSSSGNAMSNIGGSKSLGSKNNYFSNLKLSQDEPDKKQKNKQNSKGDKKKGPPKDFVPNKFALKLNPPTIILQYMNPENKKLYHHQMRLKKLKKDTNTKDALDFLRKKHSLYFAPKVIDEQQIEKLIEKLKKDLVNNDKSQMQEVQQQGDFDFDYDDDFDDLGDN